MKAINKKNIEKFIEYLNRNIVENDGFILEKEIEIWLKRNGKDYFINREISEWEESED